MCTEFTIVLVDDDIDEHDFFREAIKELKDSENIRLIDFDNGEKFIKWIQKEETLPCVIFLDIHMPYLNGFDTLLLLKKMDAYKSIPAIIYSNSDDPLDIRKAYANGADLFMSKLIPVQYLPLKLQLIIDSVKSKQPMQMRDFMATAF